MLLSSLYSLNLSLYSYLPVGFTPPNTEAAEVMLGFTVVELALAKVLGFPVEMVPLRVVEDELTTPLDGATGDDPERCILVLNDSWLIKTIIMTLKAGVCDALEHSSENQTLSES